MDREEAVQKRTWNKKPSAKSYIKHLQSHNTVNLEMDLGDCFWDFTDEEKPVSEIMYLVQSPLARKMGARI